MLNDPGPRSKSGLNTVIAHSQNGSADVNQSLFADGMIALPEGDADIEAGVALEFIPFYL